jgi:pyruvate ferredoxin oxidoreductase alpha subunit
MRRSEMKDARVMEGSEAIASAIQGCRPHVISAYPISPQTHIVENLARMIADGDLKSEMILVESEFSAASVVTGASAAGGRAYTASSSQGLLLMTEVIYNAAGMRLPFVMTGVNRSVSAPISIQVDQQDSVSLRDSGIIQLYAESSMEAYDLHLMAFRIAEDAGILLPVMVCVDGWILTHNYEPVSLLDPRAVDRFLPPFEPQQCLDVNRPLTYGSYAEDDVLMEMKYSIHEAMIRAKARIKEIMDEYGEVTGRHYAGLIEAYRTEGAEVVLVGMGSVMGTAKDAVDEMREQGIPVGLIKVRCYRPFPYEDIIAATGDANVVSVMDMNFSMGSGGAMGLDLKAKFCNVKDGPVVLDFVAGLAGREVNKQTIWQIVEKSRKMAATDHSQWESDWVDLNKQILPTGGV